MSERGPLLAEPRQAIYDYLDALLREIPDAVEEEMAETVAAAAAPAAELQEWDPAALAVAEAAAVEMAAPVAVEPVEPVAAAPAVVEEPVLAEPIVAADPVVTAEPERVAAPVIEAVPEAPAVAAAPALEAVSVEEGPPEWAKPDFQALLFDVGGLMLAVPLVKLHSVVPWSEHVITPMPRQPSWCHGLMRYRDLNVRVIDTAALVLPPDRQPPPDSPPQRILVVGDGHWALSCRAIGNVIRLDADAVKWRTRQGKRPWLAGTVREQLCALIDTEAFAAMLAAKH